MVRLKDMAAKFGELIRERRENCGISQEQLAETAGVNRWYLARIENALFTSIGNVNITKIDEALRKFERG